LHRPAAFAFALALLVAAASPVLATPVTFRFAAPAGAQQVTLAGSFNGWDASATPMSDPDGDGVFEATLELRPGPHQYKFVVNGTQWITDESAASFVDDGFGGKNSAITVGTQPMIVGTAGTETPKPPAASPTATGPGTSVTFRYQPVIGGVESVSVAGSFNDWNAAAEPLADADGDGVWETTVSLTPGDYQYKFVVNGTEWFPDDFAADTADDGFGGKNSVIHVKTKALVTGPGGNVAALPDEDGAPAEGLRSVTFRYRPEGTPNQLALAGNFNDWQVGKTLMTDPDGDGEYTATLLLAPGDYQYKFVADGNWITDQAGADDFVDDGFGGKNSVIHVNERFAAVSLARGDGEVFTTGAGHRQNATEVNNLGSDRVELTFRAHKGDLDGFAVRATARGKDLLGPAGENLDPTDSDTVFDYYRVTVHHPGSNAFRYMAEYHDGDKVVYLSAKGFGTEKPSPEDWFLFSETAFPPFETPDWVKDAVIYQIFPERFRNGDPSNDPDFSEGYYTGKTELPASGTVNGEYYHLVKDWYDVSGLSRSPYRTDGKPDYFSFYGGDIAGVRQGLDYLQDLGVTAIYFNPLFTAKSNHKYDACTFMEIDPHFGTNEEFKAFVRDAHDRGIRVILDIVFNHTGKCHWAFQDALEKGPESPYFTWYEFKQWPVPENPAKAENYYYCWWGFGDLPDLNYDLSRPNPNENGIHDIAKAKVNQPLIDHLMEVVDLWIGDMDCDGVRLDVANEVPFWFWKAFNARVKGIKKDAYIVGELWGNASDYIGADLYDATMNYAFFRDPVTKFLGQGRGTAREFDRVLATGRSTYPTQAVQVMMNLVDSHDTVRYLTAVGNDPNRVKLTELFAFTYVGAPHIYYGDEIGMTGGKDPDCRRPFLWNWAENPQRTDLHDYYRKLATIRKSHAALRRGAFRTLEAKGSVFAFERALGDDRVIVALNAGKQPTVAALGDRVTGTLTDLLTGETFDAASPLPLGPEAGVILQPNP